MKKLLIASALLCLAQFTTAFAQERATRRSWGLTASLQQSDYSIMVPLWLGERFVLAPAVSIATASDGPSDIGFALVPKYYLSTEAFAPYVSLRVGGLWNKPADNALVDTDKKFDMLAGLAFGAEYFFVPQFSLGVEAQGNFTFSDEGSHRFGNPGGTSFNLGSAVTASIYFLRK